VRASSLLRQNSSSVPLSLGRTRPCKTTASPVCWKGTITRVEKRIEQQEEKLKQGDVFKVWKKKFGREANLGSRPQLGQVLFNELGHESTGKTKTGRFSTAAADLEKLDVPFVKQLIAVEKLKKLRSTYLLGVLRETVDGVLHPFYNLHLARTYRSSSDSPNFQNLPIRDPKLAKLLRRAFIPFQHTGVIAVS